LIVISTQQTISGSQVGTLMIQSAATILQLIAKWLMMVKLYTWFAYCEAWDTIE